MTRGRRPTRGATALPAALAAVAVSAALTAAVAELSRIEVLVARQRRTAASALAAADACLAEVMAAIPSGWDLGALLIGRDGVAGTADDGVLAAPAGCRVSARAAPGPIDPPRVLLTVTGRASGGLRTLEALAGRDPSPTPAALLWLGEAPAPGTVTGVLRLDGGDPAQPMEPHWAGVAAPADPAALDTWVSGEAPHLAATLDTGSPITASPPPLAALAARLHAATATGAEALVSSSAPTPSLAVVASDLTVPGTLHGAGLLLVEGVLDVGGSLDFSGVLVASGGVRVAAGARLTVTGALWLGAPAPPGQPLLVDGDLAVRSDRAAVAAADRLLTLPRRAVVLGLLDLG